MGSCYRASALSSTQHLCQVTHPSDSRKRPLSPRWGGFVCALVFKVVLFLHLCFFFFWFFNICFICTCPVLFSSGSELARCCLCFLLLCDVSCYFIAYAFISYFFIMLYRVGFGRDFMMKLCSSFSGEHLCAGVWANKHHELFCFKMEHMQSWSICCHQVQCSCVDMFIFE